MKSSVLCAAYIDASEEYKLRISNLFNTIEKEHPEKMESLVTENFQLLDGCKVA